MSSFEQNFVSSQFNSDQKSSGSRKDSIGQNNSQVRFERNGSQIRFDQNNSQIRLTKQSIRESVNQQLMSSIVADDQSEVVLEKLTRKNITFITENEFKLDSKCYVCDIPFGNFSTRQHHCRLCAGSVCGPCSMKRVNDTRVSDYCFYKLKNFTGEKRKQALLDSSKKLRQKLANNLVKCKKENDMLEKKLQLKINESQQALEEQQNEQSKMDEEILELQAEILEYEPKIPEIEEVIKQKMTELKKLKKQHESLNNECQTMDQEKEQLQDNLKTKEKQFEILQQEKKDMEDSNDIRKLPNYQKASKYQDISLSEAIISLDSQYPPEDYYKKKNQLFEQNGKSNSNLDNIDNSSSTKSKKKKK